LGSNLPKAAALAELYALIAAWLPASTPGNAMSFQDSFSVRTIVMVVIDVSMLGRIFR
jgi:hypothetical protein